MTNPFLCVSTTSNELSEKEKVRCFPNCEMFLVWKKHWILKKDKDSLKISYMINFIFLGCI